MRIALVLVSLILIAASPAFASAISVTIQGDVEYNQVTIGQFGSVVPGDPAEITFTLDTTNYVDSMTYPTRGYVIDEASFLLTVGSATVHLRNPFPGTPYFVVRDNDPAVDGFFFSVGTDFPTNLELDEAANGLGTRFFGSHFEVSYTQTTLSSLDIAFAVGTYDYTGIQSFHFTVQDLGFDPIGFIFSSMTIAMPIAVEPSTWGGIKALYQ